MFQLEELNLLFDELNQEWKGKPQYEDLLRDTHLAVALSDAARLLPEDLSPIVLALIEKHKPRT